MSLRDRMLKSGSITNAAILADSKFFNNREFVETGLPILNVAFSGKLDGGMVPGLTTIAGESKSFKTLLALYCLRAYFNKYPDAVCLLYDSEFGITPEYLLDQGIDTDRVIHIPVIHIEQLKFDIVKRLEEIEKDDKVFILIDSVGNLASKKEAEDAMNENSAADMSRAKALKSLFRIITPHFTTKNIPCVAINHIYKTMELYSKTIVGGGSGAIYSSNQIFIITKAQEKDGTELEGFKFTINIDKSRFVREKSKLPFSVSFEDGINKWSSLLDLALESGDIANPKKGWYCLIDPETGEDLTNNMRKEATECDAVLGVVLKRPKFHQFVEDKFRLKSGVKAIEQEIESEDEVDIEEQSGLSANEE